MNERAIDFVALDLASILVLHPAGVRRCLDTAFRACDADDSTTGEPILRHVYGALDRVLVAHVTCDPFVHAVPGVTSLLGKLRRRGIAALGVASFSTAVATAAAKRFGWLDKGLVLAPNESDPNDLWSAALATAARLGHDAAQGALLSDDPWELVNAARRGSGMTIALDVPSARDEGGRTLRDAIDRIEALERRGADPGSGVIVLRDALAPARSGVA